MYVAYIVVIIYMCYSLFAALFPKIFLSHPPFKYPRSAPDQVSHATNVKFSHFRNFHKYLHSTLLVAILVLSVNLLKNIIAIT